PLLNPCSCECVEYNSNEVLGFGWLGKDAEALLEKSTDGKIRWSPKACFTCSHVTNSRQSESSQLSTIHVERKQVPKVLNTTQVIWLDVSFLITCSSGFLVPESDFEDRKSTRLNSSHVATSYAV